MFMSMSLADAPAVADNAPAYTVSELAFALKRTLEDTYGFVRLRGELSKVTRHASGHIYLSLKDDHALNAGLARLTSRPWEYWLLRQQAGPRHSFGMA